MKQSKYLIQLLTAAAGLALATQVASAQLAYTSGHADIGFGYEEEDPINEPGVFEFHPHWHTHNDDPGEEAILGGMIAAQEEYDADAVFAVVPGSAAQDAANNATFNTGTGATAGSTYWLLPQSEEAGVPYIGLGADELDPLDWVGGEVEVTLGTVVSPSGNGHFSLYQFDGSFNFFLSTADAGSNGGVTLQAGDHDHFSWAFTETGTWLIDFTVSGEHVTDGLQTGTETFSFSVVPEPSSYAALLGLIALGVSLIRRRL